MKVLSLLLRNFAVRRRKVSGGVASMKVLSLLLRNTPYGSRCDVTHAASMKVLSLLLRNAPIYRHRARFGRCLNESPELIAQEFKITTCLTRL